VANTAPGQTDYASAVAAFRLEDVERLFQGSFTDGLNVCVECCDRHPQTAVALEWEGLDGRRSTLTFADLKEQSARVANFLAARGTKPGDVVAAMLPRTPELVTTILGTWRAGAVYQPLFTAFGPKAVEQRLRTSNARLVVTDAANRAKFDGLPAAPPVAVVRRSEADMIRPGDVDFDAELARQSAAFEPVMRRGGDLFMMMSTSGTTGQPKGVPVPLSALTSILVYMRDCIGLRAEDRFWNLADPGWAYGLYYAVIGPLLMGHATTLYEGPFTVETTYRIIDTHRITNLAGAPTAFRLMIAAGPEAAAKVKGRLRAINSAGEPLNPEIVRWCAEHLAAPIHDHYGQTENGIMVANHHRLRHSVKPGSAGFPVPGFRIVVLDEASNELPPNVPGVLAVDMARSPLMWFTGYWQQETPAIGGGYYRTGDTVELEPDGRFSFIGRSDDVITSAGYRIGPFDVESALIEHPAVVESAVVGKPDAERTEIVKAFVVLKPGAEPSNALAEELSQFVKQRLSAHAYPREVEFVAQLPKTPSGKLQRFILRSNEIAKMGRTPPA
jgi:acetyl-CoA synthetase